eukprot:TRINITY_DN23408_c0_g1_i2.p1 TRINITY_DN23408_c0_g1~~TRINITY_DN23408_c0_g1_i2.p1  ORF type:complete len:362 (+),score=74.90 TRINITY_DN23408_c0_g1_i2:69-1154(+)
MGAGPLGGAFGAGGHHVAGEGKSSASARMPFTRLREEDEDGEQTAGNKSSLTTTELPRDPGKRRSWQSYLAIAAFLGLIVLSIADHARIHECINDFLRWCRHLGWIAPILVGALVAILSLLCLPTFPLMVGAGVLFPQMYGTVVGELVGVMSVFCGLWVGSMAAFQLGRSMFREWAQEEMQKFAWMGVLNAMIDEQGWWVVMLARMSPALPAEIFNYACSLTSLSLPAYGVGCIGSVVPVAFWVCSTASAAAMAGPSLPGKKEAEEERERKEMGLALLVINVLVLALLSALLYSSYQRYKDRASSYVSDEVERQAIQLGANLTDAERRTAEGELRRSVSNLSCTNDDLSKNVFRFQGQGGA